MKVFVSIWWIVSIVASIRAIPTRISLEKDVVHVFPIDWSKVKLEYLVPSDLNDYLRKVGGDLKFSPPTIERRGFREDVLVGRVPYQVGIAVFKTSEITWCNGALISRRFVLTAAHCLDSADKATIFVGAHNIQAEDEPGRVIMSVINKNFIIHEGWNRRDMLNDVALIKLPFNVEYSDRIQPIQLLQNQSSLNYMTATVSGWGKMLKEDNMIFGPLQQSVVTITDQDVCKKYYKNYIDDKHLCVMSCKEDQSDNGEPLVIDVAGSKLLTGVSSYGIKESFLVVFTDVLPYLDWISRKSN